LSCPGCLDRFICFLLSVTFPHFQAEELNNVSVIFSSFLLSLFDISVSVLNSSSMLGLAGLLMSLDKEGGEAKTRNNEFLS